MGKEVRFRQARHQGERRCRCIQLRLYTDCILWRSYSEVGGYSSWRWSRSGSRQRLMTSSPNSGPTMSCTWMKRRYDGSSDSLHA